MSAADTGAAISIEQTTHRPGWVCLVVTRRKKRHLMWLSLDEAAQLRTELDRVLPAVEVRRVEPKRVAS